MKNSWKRFLSLLLVLCLCVGLFPAAALAEDAEDSAPAENDTPDVAPVEADAPGGPEPDAPETLTFTVQPEDGEIPAGESCAVSWALSFEPERQELLLQEADESGELLLSLAEELPADARSWEIAEPGTYCVRAWLGENCALSETFTLALVGTNVSGSPEAGEEGDSLAAPGEEPEAPLQPAEPAAPPEGEPRADLEPEEEMDALPADGEINASSGTCGDNLTWTLDDVGTLTISGTGAMTDYDYTNNFVPWYSNRSSILRVVLGPEVTSIGSYAFYACSSLTSITIPASVIWIDPAAFYDCGSLRKISFRGSPPIISNGPYWSNGTYYNVLPSFGNVLAVAYYPKDAGWTLEKRKCYGGALIWVPEGDEAPDLPAATNYGSCGTSLAWVLDTAGTLTVYGAGEMTDYYISDNPKYLREPPWYSVRSSIHALVFEAGLSNIGDYAFYDCDSLTSVTIPESVTSIDFHAFEDCSALMSVTIPASVTSIADDAFKDCSALREIHFVDRPTVSDSFEGVFAIAYYPKDAGWTTETLRNYGGALIWVREGEEAPNLSCVIGYGSLSNTLTWALDNLGQLTVYGTGDMPDYSSASNAPWYSQRGSVKTIVITDGVTGIGSYAFSGCSSLNSVSISASVTTIGDSAFSSGNLSWVRLAEGSQLKRIGASAFSNQARLHSFPLPEGLESIGSYAFASCKDYVNVSIPDSVTSLGTDIFKESGLQSAVHPSGVPEIPAGLFRNCRSLRTVTIPEGVISIGEQAFYSCANLHSVELPSSVVEIGKEAFRGTCLQTINLSHVETIREYAFAYMTSSNADFSLDLSAAVNLGEYAFTNNYSVYGSSVSRNGPSYRVTLCSNLRAVPEGLFQGANIVSITLPNGLTEIGYGAFRGSSLTKLSIPSSVTDLGSYAFAESGLIRVDISSGVVEIPQSCFYRCFDLQAALIPATVSYFGANAFSGCSELTIYGSNPSAAKTYADENSIPFKLQNRIPSLVSALRLDRSRIVMTGTGIVDTLSLSLQPNDGLTGAIHWSSSDESVVSISKVYAGNRDIEIYARDYGTAVITVSAGGLSASCTVIVPAALTGVSLPQNRSLVVGKSDELHVYPNPEKATLENETIRWKSSNTKVLSVTPVNNGESAMLVGVAPGTATVTVTVGKLSAKTTVTVLQQPVESLNLRREGESALLNDGELTLAFVSGAKLQLSAEREPASATAKLNWTSSDTKVATVSDGMVTLKGAGSTVITVRAADAAGATAAFRLNVLDLKPRLSAATVTVNSYLEAGTPLEILPAEDSEIIGAELLLKKNGAFVPLDALDFTPTEGNGYELRYPGLGKVRYSAYVRAEVWCERIGQSVSFELPLKINVVNTAPKVKITLEKVNTFYPEHSFAVTAAVTNGTLKEYVLAETSNPYFELDESGDLILSEEARALVAANPKTVLNKQPVVFQVWCEGGKPDAPITVSVKPAVTYAKPTVKLGALRFNRFYTDREYPLPLTVNNGEVAHVELAADSSPCFDLDPASRTLSLNRTAWARLAADPKAKFPEAVVLKVQLADVDEVFTVSAKPTVSRTVPKLYLADVETGAKLSALTYNDFLGKDTARFAIYDASTKAPAPISEITSASAVFEPAVLDSAAGAAQLQKVGAAAPAKTVLTVSSETWDAPLTLSVSFKYEKQPTVAYNAAGKLDLLLRSSTEIIYTPKISNAAGAEVMDIELLSVTDAKGNPVEEELFELDFQAELGTARLSLVPGAEIAKAKYNLVLGTTLELDGVQNQLESKVIVTPTQSKLTLKSGSTKLNVVTGGSAYAYVYAQPEGVKLQRLAVTGTLPAGLSVSCNRVTGEVIFNAAEGMKKGTYSVKLAAEAVGAAEGTAASTLVFKITVK